MVSVSNLGHVVLYVSDLDVSEKFYQKFLGLSTKYRFPGSMIFMAANPRSSHELALFKAAPGATLPASGGLVMNHFAWRVAEFEELQAIYDILKTENVRITSVQVHWEIALGVYFVDPDGYKVEVYHELPVEEWPEVVGDPTRRYPNKLVR